MALTLTRSVPDPSAVSTLAIAIEHADGAPPLSDQSLAQLTGADVTHLSAYDGERLVGYAQLAGDSAEIAAEASAVPLLLDAALDAVGTGPLLVWSHGRRSRLAEPLHQRGFVAARELFQLRRPLANGDPVPVPADLPAGVRIRAFEPGRDDAAWLALNAAAFATHPEQGRWTQRDLDARAGESWFDPAGFLLAERGTELLAFHWTKIHDDGAGEVYVLGVSPAAQGEGLGRIMLLHGLHHLARRGCPHVLLYVDGDNTAALRLYRRDGFTTHDVDVQWRRSG